MRRLSTVPARRLGAVLALGWLLFALGCSSSPTQPKPVELPPNVVKLGMRLAWTASAGEVDFPLQVQVTGHQVALASSDGTVRLLDASNGHPLWQASVGEPLAAGVGSDGQLAAVVTRSNQLVALADGKVLWRQKLAAQAYTAPLVAGARVFVLAADRSVLAFDGRTGRRLWGQQRTGEEPLVLRRPGVLLPVGDNLIVGLSGRLAGMEPAAGGTRWEAAVGSSRGTNDVERLIDLVGPASRQGDVVCARAFQVSVGCVDARRGALLWSRPALGAEGLSGDEQRIFGTELDGRVVAWRRADGERAWESEMLKYHGLTAPIVLGKAVAMGDRLGLVHLLSREDGSPLNRLSTDGSGFAADPVVADGTLVVVTRRGGIFGFRPE